MFSPWEGEEFNRLLESFQNGIKKNSTKFSWLDIDKNLSKLGRSKYIRYGIPNHIQGDIEKARLFLCLINPNIEKIVEKNEGIGIQNFYNNSKALSSSDVSLNILDTSGSLKINENFIKNHIINTSAESSILLSELKMIERKLPEFNNKIELNSEVDSKKQKEKFQKENAYYLTHYFANICMAHLGIEKRVRTLAFELDDLKELKKMAKYIANLEAYPFRSKEPNFKFTEVQSKVSMFSARIIIWRICKSINESTEKNMRPIFLFRRFNDGWKKSIRNVLIMDLDFSKEEADDIIDVLLQTYFLTIQKIDYKNTSSSIGKDSLYIRKVDKQSRKIVNKNINKEEFNEIFSDLFR